LYIFQYSAELLRKNILLRWNYQCNGEYTGMGFRSYFSWFNLSPFYNCICIWWN